MSVTVKVLVSAGIAVTISKVGLQGPPNTNTLAEGADQTVQFNDLGVMRGATPLKWNKSTNELTLTGASFATRLTQSGLDLFPASPGNYGLFRTSTTTEVKSLGSVDVVVSAAVQMRASSGRVDFLTSISGAAATIEQRNGFTPQVFRVFNSYTDPSNNERAIVRWTANTLQLGSEAVGTGLLRDVALIGNNVHLQGGGSPRWYVSAAGVLQPFTTNAYDLGTSVSTVRNIYVGTRLSVQGGDMLAGTTGQANFYANSAGVGLSSLAVLAWSNSNTDGSATKDLILARDGANALGQRNGVNTQTSSVYNSYTDPSNWSRMAMLWDATYGHTLRAQAAGTGAWDTMALDALRLAIRTGTAGSYTSRWVFDSAGVFRPDATGTYDIGTPGLRVQSMYLSTSVFVGTKAMLQLNNPGLHGQLNLQRAADGFGWAVHPDTSNSLVFETGSGGVGTQRALWTDTGALMSFFATAMDQRNGLTPTVSRVYNSYTDPSNWSRGSIGHSGSFMVISTEGAGTGLANHLALRTPSGTSIYIGPGGGSDTWLFANTGHFYALTDNTYDIGLSTGNKPRNVWVAGYVNAPGGFDLFSSVGVYGVYRVGTDTQIRAAGTTSIQAAGATAISVSTSVFFSVPITGTGTGAGIHVRENSGTSQAGFYIYNAYTDPSNYERVQVGWNTNLFTINPQNVGTGLARIVSIDGVQIRGAGWNPTSVTIGNTITNGGNTCVAVGHSSTVSFGGTAIGYSSTSTSQNSIAIGASSIANSGTGGMAIGHSSQATGTNSAIALGYGAISDQNQTMVIGHQNHTALNIRELYIGSSRVSPVPGDITIAASGGSGTDIAGANMTISGGRPTGSGVGGAINFATATAGTTGTTLRATVTRGWFDQIGNFVLSSGLRSNPFGAVTMVMGYDANGGFIQSWGSKPLTLNPQGNDIVAASGVRFGLSTGPMLFTPDNTATIEHRNGTTPQLFKVYNTYTDPSNYERGVMQWSAAVFTVGTEAAGTGLARSTRVASGSSIVLDGTLVAIRDTAGTTRWQFNTSGMLVPQTDNTFDVGGPSNRVRIVYAATRLDAPVVQFPATQVASADPNALDDYEEGTFTPTITFGGGSTGLTYSSQDGAYTKIGRAVHFRCYMVLSNKGSSTGVAKLNGLPFTNGAGLSYNALSVWGTVLSSIVGQVMSYVEPGLTTAVLQQLNAGTAAQLNETNFNNSTSLMISGTYFV